MTWLGRRHTHHGALPEAPAPAEMPRTLRAMLAESTGALEVARLLSWMPWLARAPRGDGQVVVLVPGFQTPDLVMDPLMRFLRLLGYEARTWGRGFNRGRVEQDVAAMVPRIEQWATESGRPVAVVGWSLGGVISRELARELPDEVDQVVTYGTPVVGGPSYTAAASLYPPEVRARVAAQSAQRERDMPVQQPITAIFTRADGIVSWSACIDRTSPRVRHVEVGSTHMGLGMDPEVWWVVAKALAQAPRRR